MERIKTLLEWVRENPVDDKYAWKEDRRKFILLIWAIKNNFHIEDKDILCIGEHTAKSITFPVVQITHKGKKYIIRYNTYDFNLQYNFAETEFSEANIYGYYNFYHKIATEMEKD